MGLQVWKRHPLLCFYWLRIEVRNIEPGAEYKGVYNVKSDSHYDVTILFASGEKLEKKLGYVTHGFNYQHTLTITDKDITINDVKIE